VERRCYLISNRLISYDLAKASDSVNHEILLAKLYFYGIQGESEDLFRYYVTNRRQQVDVKSPTAETFSLFGVH
jgi:hypothetical protein